MVYDDIAAILLIFYLFNGIIYEQTWDSLVALQASLQFFNDKIKITGKKEILSLY